MFQHTNKTAKSKSTTTQADAAFKPASKKDLPEFDSRKYREDEERRIEQAIERQKRQRLERDATLANPPIKQQKQRGRARRIPEVV